MKDKLIEWIETRGILHKIFQPMTLELIGKHDDMWTFNEGGRYFTLTIWRNDQKYDFARWRVYFMRLEIMYRKGNP